MSNWPEAIWIVKKLQKNFDFTAELNYYTVQLNTLNTRINNLIDRVAIDETQLRSRVITFASVASNGLPENVPQNVGDGTIWLVIK